MKHNWIELKDFDASRRGEYYILIERVSFRLSEWKPSLFYKCLECGLILQARDPNQDDTSCEEYLLRISFKNIF